MGAAGLIAPAYVKPFVNRQKNDAAHALAICEAAQLPNMRFVPMMSEQQQASAAVFRARDLFMRQRTQFINALWGFLAEHGWVAPKRVFHARGMMAKIEDPCANGPFTDGTRTSALDAVSGRLALVTPVQSKKAARLEQTRRAASR